MARRSYSDDEARRLVAAWRSSGVGMKAFAQSQGMWPSMLYRLRARCEASMLVPVRVVHPPTTDPVEVYLRSGHRVVLHRGFDAETLSRVLKVLQ